MKTVLGIDEAGRGPIIGPLVMAGVVLNAEGAERLSGLGVRDSKTLSRKRREELYPEILRASVSYKTIILEPAEIDAAVSSFNTNLNWLEAGAAAEIINHLKPDSSIIDCPSPNIPSYRNYLMNLFENKQADLVIEHKAEHHAPVAAASIVAKVTRDNIIESIKSRIGVDFGSGYLTDEKTLKFLEDYHEKHPEIFRKSWKPYRDLISKRHQYKLDAFGS